MPNYHSKAIALTMTHCLSNLNTKGHEFRGETWQYNDLSKTLPHLPKTNVHIFDTSENMPLQWILPKCNKIANG